MFKQKDKDPSDGERKEEIIIKDEDKDEETLFNEKWGWKTLLYELSGNDPIIEDKWLESAIYRFLTHISFKRDHDSLINKKQKQMSGQR